MIVFSLMKAGVSGCVTVIGLLIVSLPSCAQPVEWNPLKKLRQLELPFQNGRVSVHYIAAAKERALLMQKSLDAANSWFEQKLHTKAPMTLAVLDAAAYAKIGYGIYPAPFNFLEVSTGQGLVGIADHGQGQPPAGADRAHASGGILQGEHQLFHEAGHDFAATLEIRSGNNFVNELIANLFTAAYIAAERPDLNWFLEDRRSTRNTKPPRYSSFADLDYLYSDVGLNNYFWFQWHLERLADFLVRDQDFASVMEKVRAAFPESEPTQATVEEIGRRLEVIRPGFLKVAGPLTGPSSISRTSPVPCEEPTAGKTPSKVIIQNDTEDLLVATFSDGGPQTIQPHRWRIYNLGQGGSLRLSNGMCVFASGEPSLAVIAKQP